MSCYMLVFQIIQNEKELWDLSITVNCVEWLVEYTLSQLESSVSWNFSLMAKWCLCSS